MTTTATDEGRPELIFAFVGPAGVRLDDLGRAVKEHLRMFGYRSEDIRLSALLPNFTGWVDPLDPTEYNRIKHSQSMAYNFRQKAGPGALVRAGIAAIRERRLALSGDADKPVPNCAFLVQQLKHPKEVALLRDVYGQSVIIVAGHAVERLRIKTLAQMMADRDKQASDGRYTAWADEIVYIDEKETRKDDPAELGQNTRDTYPLADFFANLNMQHGENSVSRFIDLLFAHPFHSPTPDEMAMHQAHATSLRSSDESRQVGAVIVSQTKNASSKITNADIVAAGLNEVPRRGGGFYWHDDSPDNRDQFLMAYSKDDRAKKIKMNALREIIGRLKDSNWLEAKKKGIPESELASELFPLLKSTQFMDIGEFMRPVHAEMAALIDAARRGVAVHGLTMYVTAFPCHNCAKHIIAAGIRRVVYLEPYPKSRAQVLHGEEINLESYEGMESDDKVAYAAFTGVAPRQFGRLFSMSLRGRKNGYSLADWNASRSDLRPRYVQRNNAQAYLLAERQELAQLPDTVYRWDRSKICPSS